MPIRNSTAAIKRQSASRYEREYRSSGARYEQNRDKRIIIPENIRRVEEVVPCFLCGVRADVPCRHRPWVAAA